MFSRKRRESKKEERKKIDFDAKSFKLYKKTKKIRKAVMSQLLHDFLTSANVDLLAEAEGWKMKK